MPDAFFASSKSRKRKRVERVGKAASSNGRAKPPRTGQSSRASIKSASVKANGAKKRNGRVVDEELSDHTEEDWDGIDDLELAKDSDEDPGASGEEDEDETPAQKRLRLAKLYLESVKEDLADGEYDAAEIDKEIISTRLKQDVLEHSGKVHLFVADSFDFSQPPKILRRRGHRLSVTSAVASESGTILFTSGKEGSIVKWDLLTGKQLATFHKSRSQKQNSKGKGRAPVDLDLEGHSDEILDMALSSDGKYLASAGRDRKFVLWDTEQAKFIKGFGGSLGHKDIISSLSFRKGTHQLYTASFDRTLKVYDLSPSVMGYVETLFGHQDHILALDSLRGETCVSVGGRDKTVRYWKIVEETQLVFRGGGRSRVREVLEGGLQGDGDDPDDEMEEGSNTRSKRVETEVTKFIEGSIECVAMIDETTFVSGGDSGSICLWSTAKKKPVFTQPLAHGLNEVTSETEGIVRTPRWITSLASLRYSDVIASGSWEGEIRLWKLDSTLKSFTLAGNVPVTGVINSLQLVSPPKDFFGQSTWASSSSNAGSTTQEHPKQRKGETPILLVAGIGKEHRLGRWLNVKSAVNGAAVFAFFPRTLST